MVYARFAGFEEFNSLIGGVEPYASEPVGEDLSVSDERQEIHLQLEDDQWFEPEYEGSTSEVEDPLSYEFWDGEPREEGKSVDDDSYYLHTTPVRDANGDTITIDSDEQLLLDSNAEFHVSSTYGICCTQEPYFNKVVAVSQETGEEISRDLIDGGGPGHGSIGPGQLVLDYEEDVELYYNLYFYDSDGAYAVYWRGFTRGSHATDRYSRRNELHDTDVSRSVSVNGEDIELDLLENREASDHDLEYQLNYALEWNDDVTEEDIVDAFESGGGEWISEGEAVDSINVEGSEAVWELAYAGREPIIDDISSTGSLQEYSHSSFTLSYSSDSVPEEVTVSVPSTMDAHIEYDMGYATELDFEDTSVDIPYDVVGVSESITTSVELTEDELENFEPEYTGGDIELTITDDEGNTVRTYG